SLTLSPAEKQQREDAIREAGPRAMLSAYTTYTTAKQTVQDWLFGPSSAPSPATIAADSATLPVGSVSVDPVARTLEPAVDYESVSQTNYAPSAETTDAASDIALSSPFNQNNPMLARYITYTTAPPAIPSAESGPATEILLSQQQSPDDQSGFLAQYTSGPVLAPPAPSPAVDIALAPTNDGNALFRYSTYEEIAASPDVQRPSYAPTADVTNSAAGLYLNPNTQPFQNTLLTQYTSGPPLSLLNPAPVAPLASTPNPAADILLNQQTQSDRNDPLAQYGTYQAPAPSQGTADTRSIADVAPSPVTGYEPTPTVERYAVDIALAQPFSYNPLTQYISGTYPPRLLAEAPPAAPAAPASPWSAAPADTTGPATPTPEPPEGPDKRSFWQKYKWPVRIGGVVFVSGGALVVNSQFTDPVGGPDGVGDTPPPTGGDGAKPPAKTPPASTPTPKPTPTPPPDKDKTATTPDEKATPDPRAIDWERYRVVTLGNPAGAQRAALERACVAGNQQACMQLAGQGPDGGAPGAIGGGGTRPPPPPPPPPQQQTQPPTQQPTQPPPQRQPVPQPIPPQVPLPTPQPAATSTATSTPPSTAVPVATLIPNPREVGSGKTAQLAWSSVYTSQCTLLIRATSTPETDKVLVDNGKTDGTVETPQLSESTFFDISCDPAKNAVQKKATSSTEVIVR
ncbi:MAG: hypothetical protein NUV59_03705, partial [Patescibacteria group bacterium]|nr:hypothetical protein [Patescibacteria group bacterium]